MDKQINQFAVKKAGNAAVQIGRSYIPHPEIKFSGGNLKWYKDSPNNQKQPGK